MDIKKAEDRDKKRDKKKKMTVHGKGLGEFYANAIEKHIKEKKVRRDKDKEMDIQILP